MSDVAKLGLVLVVALVLLVGITQLIKADFELPWMVRGRTTVHVRFENGMGLRKNMPLKEGGEDIGIVREVRRITLSDAERAELQLRIDDYKLREHKLRLSAWIAARIEKHNADVQTLEAFKALGVNDANQEAFLRASQREEEFNVLCQQGKIDEFQTMQAEFAAMSDPGAELLEEYDQATIRLERGKELYPDALFIMAREGLLGEKFLSVDTGRLGSPVGDGYIFYGQIEEDVNQLVSHASGMVANVETLMAPGGTLTNITDTLHSSLAGINDLVNAAGGLLGGSGELVGATLTNFKAMSANFLTLSENLERTSLTLQSYADDPRYKDELTEILANLRYTSQSLNQLAAEINALAGDDALQQNVKDSVRLTKETLEETKATMQRFQQTLDTVDDTLGSAGELFDEAGSTVTEVRSKIDQASAIGDSVDIKLGLNLRAVDKDDNQQLNNNDTYVGDMNLALGYDQTYLYMGADNIGEDSNTNFLLGYGGLTGLSFRGGVYRGELGFGAAYGLPGGGGAELMLYDTGDPKFNGYGYVPVGDHVNVVVGVEDIENDPQASVGLGVEF